MKRFAVPVLALVVLVCTSGAQQDATKSVPAAPDDTSRIVLEVNRVNLLFTVTDKKGRFITDLTKEDFEISENKKPQTIMQFTAESDLPLRLAILIDTSNSIRDRFHFQQEAAEEFIRVALRPEADKAMVVSFDSSPELVSDLTGDTRELEKAIEDLRPGGGTSLYDAVFFACRDKLMQDQPRHKFRRAMVILSDGDDNQSRYTRDQALEMAKSGLFDLLLLDLRLPGRSGLDVLSRLRPRSRLPVIALSERNAPAQIVAALEAGADDCMSKPYAFAELLARVRVRLRPRLARAAAG